MADQSFLQWPFFEEHHRELAHALDAWCAQHLPVDHTDVDAACRGLVAGPTQEVCIGIDNEHCLFGGHGQTCQMAP